MWPTIARTGRRGLPFATLTKKRAGGKGGRGDTEGGTAWPVYRGATVTWYRTASALHTFHHSTRGGRGCLAARVGRYTCAPREEEGEREREIEIEKLRRTVAATAASIN